MCGSNSIKVLSIYDVFLQGGPANKKLRHYKFILYLLYYFLSLALMQPQIDISKIEHSSRVFPGLHSI